MQIVGRTNLVHEEGTSTPSSSKKHVADEELPGPLTKQGPFFMRSDLMTKVKKENDKEAMKGGAMNATGGTSNELYSFWDKDMEGSVRDRKVDQVVKGTASGDDETMCNPRT
jgi:hypothetical protein